MEAFYQFSKEEALDHLRTTPSDLNNEVIPLLLRKFGENVLKEAKQKSKLSILLAQFTDVMILILVSCQLNNVV